MRFFIAVYLFAFALSTVSFAQNYPRPLLEPGENQISGGLGISWIDGTPYYMLGVMPDLQFGKIGVGLDLTLRISSIDGTIRKVDWSDGAYRKVIRYISWGNRQDPIYAKVGQLDMATIGHGFIVYDYNNSPSYDNRTIGAEADLDFTKFGFEAMYGNFKDPGVMGGRAYVRRLKFTSLDNIPIVGGFELGATYVTDQNPHSNAQPDGIEETQPAYVYEVDRTRMSEYGLDAGLPVLRSQFVDADLYYDYAQIVHFGHGNAVGILGAFRGIGLANASVKIEHQWVGSQFIPEYYDQFYELQRYEMDPQTGLSSKATELDSTKKSQGWYGQLTVALLQDFQIVGAYRGIDHDPNGGLLHLETRFPNLVPMIAFSAGYDKWGVQKGKNIFTLDDHSLLYAFFGYKPYPFMTVGFNYYWTFVPESGTYVVQRRVEPRVMVNFDF